MAAFSTNPKHFGTMAEREQIDEEEAEPLLDHDHAHDKRRSRCVVENVSTHQPSEANAEQEEAGARGTLQAIHNNLAVLTNIFTAEEQEHDRFFLAGIKNRVKMKAADGDPSTRDAGGGSGSEEQSTHHPPPIQPSNQLQPGM